MENQPMIEIPKPLAMSAMKRDGLPADEIVEEVKEPVKVEGSLEKIEEKK
jgi:hypothetical protein